MRLLLLCFSLVLAVAFSSNTIAAGPESLTDDQRAAKLVDQALLSELKGDLEQRNNLLQQATKVSPEYAPAHWQLGQVYYATKWRSLNEIGKIFSEKKQLAEYRQLRKRLKPNAQSHVALANWCLKNSLEDEHRVHLLMALRFKPGDKRIIQRLGKLISKTELALLQERRKKAQEKSKKWYQDISKLRHTLIYGTKPQRAKALDQLLSITDPAAIFALEAVFLKWTPPTSIVELKLRGYLIQVIGRMPQYEATLALTRQAVYCGSPVIREVAINQLKSRPQHEYVPLLIAGMRSPTKAKTDVVTNYQTGITTSRHTFIQEGPNVDRQVVRQRQYIPRYIPTSTGAVRNEPYEQFKKQLVQALNTLIAEGDLVAFGNHETLNKISLTYQRNRDPNLVNKLLNATESARLEKVDKVRQKAKTIAAKVENAVEKENLQVFDFNQQFRYVLGETTGVHCGTNPGNWWRWWKDYNELYTSGKNPVYSKYFTDVEKYLVWSMPTIPSVPDDLIFGGNRIVQVFVTGQYGISCFVAGTKVQTITGPVAIETILPGDRVLAQDPDTGQLAYKPVLATTVRPPDQLVKIGLGDSSITVTRGHPFWVTGHGWRMAKLLKVGDRLHSVKGSVLIDNVLPDTRQKTYNLVVDGFHTYFVGDKNILVHDNIYRRPTTALLPGLARKAIR